MATPEQMRTWLESNPDKAGTTDFVKVKDAYDTATAGTTAAAPSVGATDQLFPAGVSQTSLGRRGDSTGPSWNAPTPAAPPSDLPTVQEKLVADRGAESPNSINNLIDRNLTNRLTMLHDIPAAAYNIGARYLGYPDKQVQAWGPQMREAAGSKEMPEDAPLWQRLLEGVAAGGRIKGAAGVPVVSAQSLIPATTGAVGGELGQKLATAAGIDPQLGGLLGGALGGAGPRATGNLVRAGTAAMYRGYGAPNAPQLYEQGQRNNVRMTGASLGNPTISDLEATLGARPGSGPTVMAGRRDMRNDIQDVIQGVADQQGATMRRAPLIGTAVRDAAVAARDDLQQRSSGRQQAMEDQIGAQTPVNVASLDRTISRLPGQTTPELSDPAIARLNTLRRMYPEPDENVQGPPAPEVAYGRLKDWRSNLLNTYEGKPPLANTVANPIKIEARGLMRDTAEQQGVPGHQFDVTQARTRAFTGEGGHAETTGNVADRSNRGAFKYLMQGGEGDPQRLQDFRRDVNAAQGVTVGEPLVNSLYGSHLNQLLDTVFNTRKGSALGPIKFADRIDEMDPRSLGQFAGGPQGAQRIQDAADLSRALHRPTVQGGGANALIDGITQGVNKLTGPVAGLATGEPAIATVSALAKMLPFHPINNARIAMLNSPSAAAAMAGRPTPFRPHVSINDISSALAALQGATGERGYK